MEQVGSCQSLLPIPISTLGGWLPQSHRTVLSIVPSIASRAMVQFDTARNVQFQRHAAVLVRTIAPASFHAALAMP